MKGMSLISALIGTIIAALLLAAIFRIYLLQQQSYKNLHSGLAALQNKH